MDAHAALGIVLVRVRSVGHRSRARRTRRWHKPLFVYAGTNSRLPILPGIALPAKLRRPILVQLRDTSTDAHDVRFDRFQLTIPILREHDVRDRGTAEGSSMN
jgi:hypothetical protein